MIGFFAGIKYQLDKPETFNAYPWKLSGYYGLDPSCVPDFENLQTGTLQLLDSYRVDDVYCGYFGSSYEDGWYTLLPRLKCRKETHRTVSTFEYEDVPPISLSFKSAGENRLRVIFGDRDEAIYYRCGMTTT